MKIESTDITVSKLLSQGWYRIPRFQRPYSWVIEDISEFWNDTVVENRGDYFIGSMVIYESGGSEYGIVDGQQRLTTITIMLCSLRDLMLQHKFDDLASGVHTKIERINLENKSEFVLKTETSFPYFQGCIQSKEKCIVSEKKVEEERNIKTAYDYFMREIGHRVNSPGATLEESFKIIRNALLNLKIVLITLGNEDDAYLIFEILNARGQNLASSDLIKNHIFRFAKNKNSDIDFPQEQWKKMVANIESVQQQVSVDDFLYHHWLSRNEQVTTKELYKFFKGAINEQNASSVLLDICNDSVLYTKMIDANERDWTREEGEVVRSLEAFILFNIKMHLPAILSLARSYSKNILNLKSFKRCIKYIEKFHFVFTAICSKRSSGTISKMYCDYAKKLNDCSNIDAAAVEIDKLKQELIKRVPSYDNFRPPFLELKYRNGFTRQKKLIDYILCNFYRHDSGGVYPDKSIRNIEHLLAQSSSASDDELDQVGSVGNLFIIPDVVNVKLSNKEFAEKKKILIETKCIIPNSVLDSEIWNFDKILNRSEKMAHEAYYSIWNI